MTRRAELAGAFMLLTRLPVPPSAGDHPSIGQCVWAYPIVGIVVGGAGAVTFTIAALALQPTIAAILAVALTILLTGALHEDGLADTADGFGGGGSAVRKLEIMRDSRIGTYGALGLSVSVAIRVAAVAGSSRPALALLLAGILGRGAMVAVLALLAPARRDGLASGLGDAARPAIFAGLIIAIACGFASPVAVIAAALAAYGMARLARRHVGGYTGDVLGAAEQLAECCVLVVIQ